MTEKNIESVFVQLLQMTQTKKIITHMVLKFHKWILGDVYDWRKFLKE